MFGTYCRLNLPVWASSREVIRATRRVFNNHARRDPARRQDRHAVYRLMLEYHCDARATYRTAVRGTV